MNSQRKKVSVAMATYNGEKYVRQQLESILENLNEYDEIIISDDNSTDSTISIIEQLNDNRIRVYKGPSLGVKQNFANAIKYCTGDYIFLADQDDVWDKDKVNIIIEYFKNEKVYVIQHDCCIVNSNLEEIHPSYFKFRKCKNGIIKNIIKGSYLGCCMAFKKEVKEYILPIPNNIDMHDQWIGLIGELKGKFLFVNEKLIKYRRHESNTSDCFTHHKLNVMIKDRLNLIANLMKLKY